MGKSLPRPTKIKRRGYRNHTLAPVSSSQSFIFNTLAAKESASFWVSPGATAAKTRTPFPIDETTSFSTVTEADSTRCNIATWDGRMSKVDSSCRDRWESENTYLSC